MHRYWLAITHSLPMKEWYFDSRFVHTLDYPPFFAYFEWLASQALAKIDSDIVDIDNEIFSLKTVIVHRVSVIASDLLLVYACYRFMRKTKLTQSDSRLTHSEKLKIWFFINYFSIGMFMIDNIHFQYNAMLFALMILSICFMIEVCLSKTSFHSLYLCF